MNSMTKFLLAAVTTLSFLANIGMGEKWRIPVAGNSYHAQPESGRAKFDTLRKLQISETDEVYSVYFHADRPPLLTPSIRGRSAHGEASLQARIGEKTIAMTLGDKRAQEHSLGEIEATKPGYVRIDFRKVGANKTSVIELSEVRVASSTEGMQLDYVKNNLGNMFYWGRRGPSVHLAYQLPPKTQLTYAYSEITVPVGQDPIGSYFMANGFSEGYFGFQVNSKTQRRVLFSVWSPFKTDNPAEIPDEDRVAVLVKGEDVHAKDFGNEGSGGQSYLVYPWKAGVTYRFLTEVKPDGAGNTKYTAWFGNKEADEWKLIASFRRPKTDKHLTGFHSFLENFSPDYGHLVRSANYGNQWVCDVDRKWHEVTTARFTGDNTARGKHRLDYAGGSEQDHFFLRNGGFFDETVKLDQKFEHQPTPENKPEIDFEKLPRG